MNTRNRFKQALALGAVVASLVRSTAYRRHDGFSGPVESERRRTLKLCLRRALACIVGALITALLASSSAAAADDCKRVNIDAEVRIAGEPRAGVVVKVGTDWDVLVDGMGFEPDGAVALTTDSKGRIKGGFDYCDGGNPVLLFRYRTDFNADSNVVEPSASNFNFTKTIWFGPSPENYRPPHPPTKVKFRFPVHTSRIINHRDHFVLDDTAAAVFTLGISAGVEWGLSGPFGADHRPLPQEGKEWCTDYDGYDGTLYCYGKHNGTDYMLIGGFDAMDNEENYVVAAADGVVTNVRDYLYDRCHLTLSGVTCDGHNKDKKDPDHLLANEITLNHGFDTTDPRYAVTTRYMHIKQYSARVKKGDFVKCGQIIAEIGSSGRSVGPHLHFEATHEGAIVDPYKGELSSQRYWNVQKIGEREFPGLACQDPKDRYGEIPYAAEIVLVGAPEDLGIRDKPPGGRWTLGKARFWKVMVDVDDASVVGFMKDNVQVKWRLPEHVVIDPISGGVQTRDEPGTIRGRLGKRITFYVPIANARSPKLSDYSFDVLAEITQDKPNPAKVRRHVHVEIPRPSVLLEADAAATKVVDKVAACGAKQPVYQTAFHTATHGFWYGGKKPKIRTEVVSQSTHKTMPSDPISVCGGDSVKVTVTAVDALGVEKARKVKTLRAPRFVTDAKVAPNRHAGSTPVAIPATHSGEKPFKSHVFKEVRVTTDPRDVGDGSLPLAIPKGPVTIAWTDLGYIDPKTKTWTTLEVGKKASVKAHYETRKQESDTLVLEFTDTSWPTVFAGKLTVTDGWGRTITQDIRGANGALPPPPTPNGLEKLLVEVGFQLGGDPEPIEGMPNSSLPGKGVAELSGLVHGLSDAYVKRDRAAVTALRTKVRTFSATTAKTKAKERPINLVVH